MGYDICVVTSSHTYQAPCHPHVNHAPCMRCGDVKHQVHLEVGTDQATPVYGEAATEVPSDDDVGIDVSEFTEGGDIEWRMVM
jgi:hypothetical protein